jgi:hypothetical protein
MKIGLARFKMKRLNELFTVTYGSKLDLNKMTPRSLADGGVSFVGRSSQNHGVSGTVERIPDIEPFPSGAITVALGGTKILSSFIQERPFYTAQNVAVLSPNFEMTFSEKLYVCLCIRHNRFRYSAFGREANRTLRTLPVPEPSEFPAWVASVDVDMFDRAKKSANEQAPQDLATKSWKPFELQNLFSIERGKGPRRKDLDGGGNTPFITSTDSNNGFTMYTKEEPLHKGNTIGVNRNGSVGEAFYQPAPFCSTEDVHVFTPKEDWGNKMNAAVGLFLTTLIRQEKYRFNYGRKWGIERMKVSTIKLPVTQEGKPDWDFMEAFIKSLPYSAQI